MGVSFRWFGDRQLSLLRTHEAAAAGADESTATLFSLQVSGLDVVARATDVRAFVSPLVSWEPVVNLTALSYPFDPPQTFNYYPDDGGPTKLFNNSQRMVPLAPNPVCDMPVDAYDKEPDNFTFAYFTLPFGIRSLAYLSGQTSQPEKAPTELQ